MYRVYGSEEVHCGCEFTVYTLYCQNVLERLPLRAHELWKLWEGFPQGLGVCFWEFLTVLLEAHL